MTEWKPSRHIPMYLRGELLVDHSDYMRVRFRGAYVHVTGHLRRWRESLPWDDEIELRPFLLSDIEPWSLQRLGTAALSPVRAPAGLSVLSAENLLSLQRQAGNRAVLRLIAASNGTIMREFEDDDKVAEDAVGVARGFAPEITLGNPAAPRVNESGLLDGEIGSGVEPHAFVDKGKTGDAPWIHTGGTGGAGNELTGAATLIAPVFETKPPKKQGGRASAWVRSGAGKIKVKRSFKGVIHGINGQTTSANIGTLWMSPRAQARIDKHERKHVKSTKEIHDQYIKPLERRVSRSAGSLRRTSTERTSRQPSRR